MDEGRGARGEGMGEINEEGGVGRDEGERIVLVDCYEGFWRHSAERSCRQSALVLCRVVLNISRMDQT